MPATTTTTTAPSSNAPQPPSSPKMSSRRASGFISSLFSSLSSRSKTAATSSSTALQPAQTPIAAGAAGQQQHIVLRDAAVIRGTAYSVGERMDLGVSGLVPPAVETLDQQVARATAHLRSLPTPLTKFTYLDRLRSESSVLFYSLVSQSLEETVAIIYTPVVGLACQKFSHIYTPGNAQGLFISLKDHRGRVRELLDASWHRSVDPQICVVTDGSRILGLGDLGVNGMGIPIGKLSLYVAAGGFDPSRTLPVTLDLGTNTKSIREDPFYLGARTERPADDVFLAFVDEVMAAFKAKWPRMLVQFEDFSSEHAFQCLDRYRSEYRCFNDDIQGTGAVILSGFINAVERSAVPISDHRILFVGAGSAAVGVAQQLAVHFVKSGGLSEAEARAKFFLIDSKGLITTDRSDAANYPDHKRIFVRDDFGGEQVKGLLEAVKRIRPTALIGLSSQGGAFTAEIIREMANISAQPIIFPLSNPSENAECTFEQAMTHTDGAVIFASGTAFPEHPHPRTGRIVHPCQGNNMYVFPALGLGSFLAQASRITDDMVYASAASLARAVDAAEREEGRLYPRLDRIRDVEVVVAGDVIVAAVAEGLACDEEVLRIVGARAGERGRVVADDKREEILAYVKGRMWSPVYGEN